MTTDVLMPSVEPSMQTGRLTRWLRREGDFVEAGDPIAEIATDRATMDVEAPQTGVLSRILVEAGSLQVPVFQQIGVIEAARAPHQSGAEEAAAEGAGRASASPRARRLAHEAGVDLAQVKGGGPNGRIVESDVRAALAARLQGDNPLFVRAREGEDGPRLHALMSAAQWTPQVHFEADCQLDSLEVFREKLNSAAREEKTAKISLVDCLVKAFALALQRAPRCNVAHAPRGFGDAPRGDVPGAPEGYALARHSDIALALAVDDKIVAPALPAAESLTLAEIAAARADFMAGRFKPAAYYGGSSLVANLGAFGIKRIFPVVVAPWTSVLAVGAAEKRVIVEDGLPEVATILSVTLTIDRHAMDEMAGAMLLAEFRRLIENPYGLML